jgi:ATP-dependent Clp protease ATP-binding subunit ClpA
MREEFTTRLRTALDKAQDEARGLNQDFVSVEHLLLGLVGGPGDSEAVEGLKLAGVVLPELRQKLIDALPRGAESPVVTGSLPLSPKARKTVNAALVKAQSASVPRVTSRLLLVSLLDDCEAAVTKALRDSGADVDHLQRLLVQDGAIPPED